jgi:predicted RNA-binding Zn ribbon-like protein
VDVMAELALVEDFLNTRDHEHGPDGLDAWLRARAPTSEEADLAAAAELREAVRAVVAAGAPGSARLSAAAGAYPLRLGDRAGGEDVLEPAGEGARAAVGLVVAAIAQVQVRGEWARLKVCPAPGCGWAFVDRSRNGSRRWCEMSSCGNQHKVRTYRARRRSISPR